MACAATSIALQLARAPQAFSAELAKRARGAERIAALRDFVSRLPRDDGAIYLERPTEFLYYNLVYFAYPRRVYVGDRSVPLHGQERLGAAARPLTVELARALGVTRVVRPEGARLVSYAPPP